MPDILPGLDDQFVKCLEKAKHLIPGTKEFNETVHGKGNLNVIFFSNAQIF